MNLQHLIVEILRFFEKNNVEIRIPSQIVNLNKWDYYLSINI